MSPGRRARTGLRAALALLLVALWPVGEACARDATSTLGEFKHVSWSMEGGAPSRINALTQSRDGYLWIGSVDGLYRFDGATFEPIEREGRGGGRLVVAEVLGARSGDVWVGLARSGGVMVYRGGRLIDTAMPHPSREVTGLAEERDGALWVARGGRTRDTLARYRDGRWEEIGAAWGLPEGEIWQVLFTRDGVMWVVMRDTILRRAPGARRFEPTGVAVDRRASLAEDAKGRLWVSDTAGTRLLSDPAGHPGGAAAKIAHNEEVGGTRILFDRRGNLWGATWTDGAFEIPAAAVDAAARTGARMGAGEKPRGFQAVDGMTSDQTHSVFQDREGDIWVGTELGLDMLRPGSVMVETAIPANSARSYRMTATPGGTVYIADAHTLYAIDPGRPPRPVTPLPVSPGAICAARDEGVWVTLRDTVLLIHGGRKQSLPKPAEPNAFGCAEDAGGWLWMPALEKGLYWRQDGRWSTWPGLSAAVGVPGNAQALRDGRAAILFRSAPHLKGPLPFEPIYKERFRIGGLEGLLPGRDALYLSGAQGFAALRGSRTETLDAERYPWLASVNGLTQTPAGDTWTIGDAGITRMRTADLDQALAHPGAALDHRTFDFRDGVNSFTQKAPGPQIEAGGDGRIWVLTRRNVLRIDPAGLTSNPLPPPVSVRAVIAADRRWRDPAAVTLPAGVTEAVVQYAGLSLAVPSRVRFRYRVQELGAAWTDAGNRREALLTGLHPGTFHFQVRAANDDGVWNDGGAMAVLTIPPTLTETWWFRVAAAALAALLLWGAFAWRLRQVSVRLRARLEVRAAERERIARELHDTLLQGVQGLIMRFQSVADHIPEGEPAKASIDLALDRADQILVEGRDRVRNLRHQDTRRLDVILRELAEQQPFDPGTRIEVGADGAARPLQPPAQDEIAHIAGEALFNVARHAQAGHVQVRVHYGVARLQVSIRDDGVGFSVASRPGHYGLIGMRERARKIGAQLSIESASGQGTVVTISLPRTLAYQRQSWLDRLLRRAAATVEDGG